MSLTSLQMTQRFIIIQKYTEWNIDNIFKRGPWEGGTRLLESQVRFKFTFQVA